MFNWKKYYAIKQEFEIHYADIPKTSGIYIWKRVENGITYFYVGQAKNLFQRRFQYYQIQCGLSYPNRHFEASLKKHKDWKFQVLETCSEDKLNEREKYFISNFNALPNYITRNDQLTNLDKIAKINAKRVKKVEKNLKKDIAKLLKRVDINIGANIITLTPVETKNHKRFTLNSIKALEEISKWIKELTNNEK